MKNSKLLARTSGSTTMLCHLANISYRTNKSFAVDPKTGHIRDADAMKLWSWEYAKGWSPIV